MRITMQENPEGLFQKNALSEQVIDILMEWIMEGKLQMGDRLNANDLAKTLGVSRMPVREALLDLEKRGLAESIPYVGMRLVKLSEEDIRQIYMVRRALEPIAARFACHNVTDKDIAELEDIHQEYERLVWDPASSPIDTYQQNRRFHFAIYKLGKLDRVNALIEQVWDNLAFFKLIFGHSLLDTDESKRRIVQVHRNYLDALIARDEDGIFDLFADNLSRRLSDLPYYVDAYTHDQKKPRSAGEPAGLTLQEKM
ncbi:MAG: GntR family transcriptional regulator [Erysipelotrichaceae bacterium]|nr:GntR family transcriptional regulator [Erysipelotrichaceae bacterium]